MILGIKSNATIEKLKMCDFYSESLVFYRYIPQIMWYYFILPETFITDNFMFKLANDKLVIEFSLDPDGLIPNSGFINEIIPDNDNFAKQWALRNTGQYSGFPGEDTRTTKAWMLEQGSYEIVVAIVDSGIDIDHQCLVGNIYVDPTEAVTMGTDADGNGYKNDVVGWNMENKNHESYKPMHGTALASIVTTNGNGMSGITWRTRIMPIHIGPMENYDVPKVAFSYPCDRGKESQEVYSGWYNSIPSARVAEGIVYAAAKGAHIILLAYSVGSNAKISCCGTYPISRELPDVRDAIKFAGRQGCVVVTSAGDELPDGQKFPTQRNGYETYTEQCGESDSPVNINANKNVFPGAYTRYFPHQINVTGHDNWGYLYYKKDYTSITPYGYSGYMYGCVFSKVNVDIAAPGKDCYSALPNNKYGLASGSSIAAAHVAGAAALVWSRNSFLKNTEVVDILRQSTRKNSYWSERVSSNGMLDVNSAVQSAK